MENVMKKVLFVFIVNCFLLLSCSGDNNSGDSKNNDSNLCSNGIIDENEVCDGSNLNNQTCASMGFGSGSLSCMSNCTGYDTSMCVQASCDDGILNQDEEAVDCGGIICEACPPGCANGVQDGDESGIDCGGSCPNQDCCANGFMDWDLGELGVDCSGNCADGCYSGTVHYVSNDGDDNNDGLTPQTAWETISKVNSESFSPGDAVLFRRGDIWREMLMISSSGNQENPITFSYYGNGEQPAIYGSAAVTTWTHVSGSVWRGNEQVEDPSRGAPHDGQSKGSGGWPGGSFFILNSEEVVWGHQEKEVGTNFDDLTQNYDWGWHDGHIYIFSSVDPSTIWAAVEVTQRSSSIEMPGNNVQNWVVIDGIQMLFTQSKGFFSGYPEMEGHGLTIKNSHVAYVGIKGGIAADCLKAWHSDSLYSNNDVHDCGRHGAGILITGDRGITISNVTFENNHFYNGWHTTGVDIQVLSGNDTITGVVMRGNHFEGDPAEDLGGMEGHNSNHVWTNNYNGTLADFDFINNIFSYCHGKCLAIQNIQSTRVYNNTFYGVNPTLENTQGQLYFVGDSISDSIVRNNIFYNNSDTAFNNYFYSIKVNDYQMAEIDIDYNLYFSTDQNAPMVKIIEQSGAYQTSEWETYKTETGYDANSPEPVNPDFVSSTDFHLNENSPAKGKGISLIDVPTDRDGVARGASPSLGAYE
jgi:hypothetical protein